MAAIEVRTGERVSSVTAERTVSTVSVVIGGRIFTTDCKDGVDAMHVAVQTARVLGVRLGMD